MLGKYERLDVLGHGVSGIVYLAKDTLLNKQVALKEVDVQAGDLRRFLEEARVMDRLRHPNIVRVNGVDRIEGKVVIDMEYVRGQNLQEILRAEGSLPLDRALDITVQILDALDYAHRMQTVHRDIKPANILVGRDGTVKLVDFGLAEILATNAYAGGAGTYAYMAPEDFAEADRSDSQSDIWAVGVTLFEILTAHRPFQVANVKDPFAWKRVLENQSPSPLAQYLPDAPPALQTILDHALQRDKRQRYQTAGEFRDDLIRFRNGEAVTAAPKKGVGDLMDRLFPPYPGRNSGAGERHNDVETGEKTRVLPDMGAATAVLNSSPPVTVGVRPEATSSAPRTRRPFMGRKAERQLILSASALDFGALRKGDTRSLKLTARTKGVEGSVSGRVAHLPAWLTAHPESFSRLKQTILLTANSAEAWETGEFQETVRIETEGGMSEIPVHMTVLKPRPTFLQVAAWYIPLFLTALLPALTVALFGGTSALTASAAALVPSAAVASGLLAVMLLLVCVAADIGAAERLACGVLVIVMGAVLGIAMGRASATEMQRAFMTAGLVGAALILQLLYLKKWKVWGVALACLGLLIGGTFLRVLLP